MIVSYLLCNTIGKQNHVSPLTKKTKKPKCLRNMSIQRKELACFWTHTLSDSLCYFCACILHTMFSYALTPWFPQSLLQTRIAATEKAIFLPSFVPKLTPPRGAWWAAAVIRKKTTLDKSCLFSHITSQNPFTTKLHEANASTMNKQATRCFGIPLGETLTQTEHFPRQLSSPTSTTCKQTPNVHCHSTNPYSTISPWQPAWI